MWCRVLLVVIALTCTFQREIIAEPDDVICVIYLSGLQKEDLDDNLLKKLQRHNVNIEDINNEKAIEKCFRSSEKTNVTGSPPAKKMAPTTSDRLKQTIPRRRKAEYNDNRTAKFTDILKVNVNNKIQSIAEIDNSTNRDTLRSSIENFIKLWITLKKIIDQRNANNNFKETKNNVTVLPITFKKRTEINSQAKDDIIDKIFGNYISEIQLKTTTLKPTTTQKQIDTKSQQTKEFLNNNYIPVFNNVLLNRVTESYENENAKANKSDNLNNKESLTFENELILNELLRQKHQLNMSDALKCDLKNEKQLSNYRTVQTGGNLNIQMPITLNKMTDAEYQSMNPEHTNKMFECYIAAKLEFMTTLKPHNNEESLTRKSDSIIDELVRQKYQMNTFDPLKINSEEELQNSRIVKTGDHLKTQMPITINNETPIGYQSINLDYINKMFECYNAAKLERTTTRPTTPQQDNSLSQQIKGFLENNNKGYQYEFVDHILKLFDNGNISQTMNNDESLKRKSNSIFDELVRQKYQLNMLGPLKINSENIDLENSRVVHTRGNMDVQIPVASNNDTEIDTQSINMEYFRRMFECYNAAKVALTTTLKPTTTQKDSDILSQEIKGFFKNKNLIYDKILANQIFEVGNANVSKSYNIDNVELLTRRKSPVQHSNELRNQRDQSNGMYGHLKNNMEKRNNLNDSRIVQTINNLPIQMPINLNKKTEIESKPKDLNYIYKTFERYLATKHEEMTTLTPTITQKNIDIISQQINNYLERNKNQYNNIKPLLEQVSEQTTTLKPTKRQKDIEIISQQIKEYFENNNFYKNQTLGKLVSEQTTTLTPTKTQKDINIISQQIKDLFDNNKNQFNQNKLLVKRVSAQTTTLKPITTQEDISIISQQIKYFLESINNQYNKTKALVKKGPTQNQNVNPFDYNNIDDEQSIFRKSDTLLYINELLRQTNQNNMSTLSENSSKGTKHLNVQAIQKNVLETNKINNILKPEVRPLPDNIIKELTEKVKASVIEDLQKQMSSTSESTKMENTTEIIITNRPKIVQEKIFNTTTGLDNFMELFKRLKNESDKVNTTEIILTNTLLQIDQNKIKDATRALENFNELFQQFRKVKESITEDPKYKLKQKKNTNNEFHGPINVLYPSLMPVNYAYDVKTQTARAMPVFINPYPVLQINNNVLQKTHLTKKRKKEKFRLPTPLEDLSNFNLNPLNNIANNMDELPVIQTAAIIQTDAIEVPLLGIPVPKSVKAINQNIIVTTKHPMMKLIEDREHLHYVKNKPRFQDYTARDGTRFSTDLKRQPNSDMERRYHSDLERQSDSDIDRMYRSDSGRQSYTDTERGYHVDFERQSDSDMQRKYHTDMERTYGQGYGYSHHGRHFKPHQSRTKDRSQTSKYRQISTIDNLYREFVNNLKAKGINNWDHPKLSSDRYKERFHEKLERPEERQRHFGDQNPPKEDKQLKVASRQQLSLNKLKEKTRYDDTHFKNFLKTQKKVNDMLEKILGPKIRDRINSVETPDTLHAYVN